MAPMADSAAFSKCSPSASPQRPYGSGSWGGSAANIGTWRGTGGIGGGEASARAPGVSRPGLAEPPRGVFRRQHVQVHTRPDLEAGQLREPRHDLDAPAEVLGVARSR